MIRLATRHIAVLLFLGVVVPSLLSGCEMLSPKTVLEVGKPAPGFELTDVDGRTWRLDDLRGKVVLVNFWATWCPSCVSELPSLQHLISTKKGDPDFLVLTIGFRDDPFKMLSFVQAYKYTFPVLKDPDGTAAKAYGLTGVPETFVVDKNGVLRKKVIGPTEFDDPKVIAYLERLEKE